MSIGDIQIRVRADVRGNFHVFSPRPLRLQANEQIKIQVFVEQLLENVQPPAYSAVDITGWAGRWICKLDVDDPDANEKWDVSGAIVSAPAGNMSFTVTKALSDFEVDFGYSELVFMTDGTIPNIRLPLPITLGRKGQSL